MVIGIENNADDEVRRDIISLFANNCKGFIGVNTKFPLYNFDISGSTFIRHNLIANGDVSMNGNLKIGSGSSSLAINKGI